MTMYIFGVLVPTFDILKLLTKKKASQKHDFCILAPKKDKPQTKRGF